MIINYNKILYNRLYIILNKLLFIISYYFYEKINIYKKKNKILKYLIYIIFD